MDLWTSPTDRREPCGPCGQPVDNADALPTACPHSRASRPQAPQDQPPVILRGQHRTTLRRGCLHRPFKTTFASHSNRSQHRPRPGSPPSLQAHFRMGLDWTLCYLYLTTQPVVAFHDSSVHSMLVLMGGCRSRVDQEVATERWAGSVPPQYRTAPSASCSQVGEQARARAMPDSTSPRRRSCVHPADAFASGAMIAIGLGAESVRGHPPGGSGVTAPLGNSNEGSRTPPRKRLGARLENLEPVSFAHGAQRGGLGRFARTGARLGERARIVGARSLRWGYEHHRVGTLEPDEDSVRSWFVGGHSRVVSSRRGPLGSSRFRWIWSRRTKAAMQAHPAPMPMVDFIQRVGASRNSGERNSPINPTHRPRNAPPATK